MKSILVLFLLLLTCFSAAQETFNNELSLISSPPSNLQLYKRQVSPSKEFKLSKHVQSRQKLSKHVKKFWSKRGPIILKHAYKLLFQIVVTMITVSFGMPITPMLLAVPITQALNAAIEVYTGEDSEKSKQLNHLVSVASNAAAGTIIAGSFTPEIQLDTFIKVFEHMFKRIDPKFKLNKETESDIGNLHSLFLNHKKDGKFDIEEVKSMLKIMVAKKLNEKSTQQYTEKRGKSAWVDKAYRQIVKMAKAIDIKI